MFEKLITYRKISHIGVSAKSVKAKEAHFESSLLEENKGIISIII